MCIYEHVCFILCQQNQQKSCWMIQYLESTGATNCCIERERRTVARNSQVCQALCDLFLFGPIGSLAFVSSQSFL